MQQHRLQNDEKKNDEKIEKKAFAMNHEYSIFPITDGINEYLVYTPFILE